jgi:F420-non-reducing hydrogenase large subunit
MKRHVLALARENPGVVKHAIELRKIGQTIVEAVGGKPIHPVTAVPGGVSKPLEEDRREELLELARSAVELAERLDLRRVADAVIKRRRRHLSSGRTCGIRA